MTSSSLFSFSIYKRKIEIFQLNTDEVLVLVLVDIRIIFMVYSFNSHNRHIYEGKLSLK